MLFGNALIQKNIQLQQEKKIAEDMMYELTRLIFHAKGQNVEHLSVNSMMELTRRRILSNPDIPKHIKQKNVVGDDDTGAREAPNYTNELSAKLCV